ncbi:MAG TPA: glycosyltransferase family 2 protein [Gemmatimonadaceae bacterium]
METGTIKPTLTTAGPALSLVMPCYNEETGVAQTVRRTLQAFERAEIALELVAVDNGSTDGTGRVLRELADRHPGIVVHRIEVNEGYGNGVLAGLPRCRAPWVGVIPADGQVDAEDAVRLFEDALATREPVLAKARRRFRMDGWKRKLVSIGYNAFFRILWPGIESLDINGLPKIMPRELIGRMGLTSRQWLLDPEIMIKAHLLDVRVLEYNVFARMRGSGLSHVRASTCWEFFRGMLRFRFSGEMRQWRAAARRASALAPVAAREGE